ncbi:MAG: hypothetical protein ACRDRT_18950 [Pseudonocardiaceae bacterium]
MIGGVVMFIHKVIMKNAMEKKLGRKVQDRELTSISSWMEDGQGSDDSRK